MSSPVTVQEREPGLPLYRLIFTTSKIEPAVEDVFLQKGGTMGAAAARGDTDFHITHSKYTTNALVTSKPLCVEMDLPNELINEYAHVKLDTCAAAGPTLVLSSRSRLNMSQSKQATSIAGDLVSSLSGQAAVPLSSIFKKVPIHQVTGTPPTDTKGAGADDLPSISMIPFKYPNWEQHLSVLSIQNARIVRVLEDEQVDVSVVFFEDVDLDAKLKETEPLLQKVYDTAWKITEDFVFEPSPNLTKSVKRVPKCESLSSGFNLAAEVNDMPPSFTADSLESVMYRCILLECGSNHDDLNVVLKELSVPSPTATMRHASKIASALSAFNAFEMPYRVDGAPIVTPEGVSMTQSESWRSEAVREEGLTADDCDGGAASTVSAVMFAMRTEAHTATKGKFPALRAIANSLGAHYVFGTTVLAANAGHADAADQSSTNFAGHAIQVAVPKMAFLSGLERGSDVLEMAPETASNLAEMRYSALYPQVLIDSMPANEQFLFETYDVAKRVPSADCVRGMQPLAIEGTSWTSAVMYKHSDTERAARGKTIAIDAEATDRLSPHILRTHKCLDVGTNGEHAFYHSFVEISVSLESPLFRSDELREIGQASPHYRFINHQGTKSGVTPKHLACGEFSIIPLWSVGTHDGGLLDLTHAESHANTLPRRKGIKELTIDEHDTMMTTIGRLRALKDSLGPYSDTDEGSESQHLISFASLLWNGAAINGFCDVVESIGGIKGRVTGLDTAITGLARFKEEEMGRLISVEVLI